ncbi:MAG TPA: hypothetical protein VF041_22355, partial [Gemmatimonadaceae bacterium]
MRLSSRIAIPAAVTLIGGATPVRAQVYDGFPGTHLTVDVHVKSIAHGDDSVRVTYVVDNQPASEERVFTL